MVPTILGHEMMGTMVAIGSKVKNFKLGDRVVPDIVLYCGTCDLCWQGKYALCRKCGSLGLQTVYGGFGEIVNMPVYTAHKLPPEVSNAFGATVAVIGCTTAFFALQAAWVSGAKEVYLITIGEERLKLAEKLGATKAIDALNDPIEEVLAATGDGG